MDSELTLDILKNMSVIGLAAYLFSQTITFKRMMNNSIHGYDKAKMIAFFTGMSVLGNYMNINVNGTLGTTRPIGIITSGILGGPAVSITVGLISGIHRYFLGGYSALASLIAAVCQGVVAGCFNYLYKGKEPRIISCFAAGILAGIVQSVLILFIAEPFELALDTFKTASITTILVNAVGVAIFVHMIKNVKMASNKVASVQTQKVLSVANIMLPFFTNGLNSFSAKNIAEAILEESDADAVCIVNDKETLAYVGIGSEHNPSGQTIAQEYLKAVLKSQKMKIANLKEETWCKFGDSKLTSALIVPLIFQDDKAEGLIAFYYTKPKIINTFDIEFAEGVGRLLARGFEIARLEQQAHMVTVAEFKALQAQIQPHFLFNSLNTIASFCRTDPGKARDLLLNLSSFLRKTINKGDMFSTIEEELNLINSYLAIQKARYGELLYIEFNIPDKLQKNKIPTLSIQPLVENSIKHGISKKLGGGKVKISVEEDSGFMNIKVTDSGVGMPEKKVSYVLIDSDGIGLKNINKRLINLYGKDFGLSINSQEGNGTTVCFKVPIDMEGKSSNRLALAK